MRRPVVRAAVLVLVTWALAIQPGLVLAAPAITVSPDPAPIGTRVRFQGTEFPADSMLTLSVATEANPSQALIAIPVPTDEVGNFGAGLTVPANGQFAPGGYTITVANESKEPLATARFTLTGDAGSTSAAPAATSGGGTSPDSPGTVDNVQRLLFVAVAVVAVAIVALVLSAVSAARRGGKRQAER